MAFTFFDSSIFLHNRWEMYLQVLVDITLNLSIYLGRSVSRVGHEKILVLFSQIFSQYLLVPCLKWSTQTYEVHVVLIRFRLSVLSFFI